MEDSRDNVDYFVTLSMSINVNGEWFLPFQQVRLIDIIQSPLVDHTTRSGFKIPELTVLHQHFLVERNNVQYMIPVEAGYVTDKKIPEEWVNRHMLEQRYRSDNIIDYVKAVRKFLNINMHGGADIAWWRKINRPKESQMVGKTLDKAEIQKEQL